MVNTDISDIASRIVQNPGQAKINSNGRLAADTYPGQVVVIASGKWTLADKDTAAHRLLVPGVVDFVKRRNDAGAYPDIDDAYDIDAEPNLDKVPVCVSGIVAAFCDDPAATVYPRTAYGISSTAGNFAQLGQEATGATSGTAFRTLHVATLLRKLVSGDTKGFFGIGEFKEKRGAY